MQVTIYHLTNPKNNQIFYVGATRQTLSARLRQHQLNWATKTTKQLSLENVIPIITALEVCGIDDASNRESFWIKKMKEDGHPIENTSDVSYYTQSHYTRLKPKKPINRPVEYSIYDDMIHEKEVIKTMGYTKDELAKLRTSGKVRYGTILLGRPRFFYLKSNLATLTTNQ